LAVALIWGGGFVASNLSLGELTAYEAMAGRFVVAAFVLGVLYRRHWACLDRPTLIRGAVLGLFLYLAFLFQTVGLVFTTPAKNAFLTAVNVILVPFLGWILFRRRLDGFGLAGAVLALAGVALISWNGDGGLQLGDGLTLVCAVGFALHIFFTGEFLCRGSDAVGLTLVQMSVAALLAVLAAGAAALSGFTDHKGGADLAASAGAVVYLGFVSTAAAFLLQTVSQKLTTQTRAAVILSTEAVFGAGFSALLLGEVLTVRTLAGSALVFAAILVAELRPGLRQAKENHGHN
jgi:drug/metabolite transporter (DMT)-like permease